MPGEHPGQESGLAFRSGADHPFRAEKLTGGLCVFGGHADHHAGYIIKVIPDGIMVGILPAKGGNVSSLAHCVNHIGEDR